MKIKSWDNLVEVGVIGGIGVLDLDIGLNFREYEF